MAPTHTAARFHSISLSITHAARWQWSAMLTVIPRINAEQQAPPHPKVQVSDALLL